MGSLQGSLGYTVYLRQNVFDMCAPWIVVSLGCVSTGCSNLVVASSCSALFRTDVDIHDTVDVQRG